MFFFYQTQVILTKISEFLRIYSDYSPLMWTPAVHPPHVNIHKYKLSVWWERRGRQVFSAGCFGLYQILVKQRSLLCSWTCPQSNKNMLELVIQCSKRGQRKTVCCFKDKNSSHSGKNKTTLDCSVFQLQPWCCFYMVLGHFGLLFSLFINVNQCRGTMTKSKNCCWSHYNKHSHAKYVRVGEVMTQVSASLISLLFPFSSALCV